MSQVVNITESGNSMYVILTDLEPYTEHEIAMRSKPTAGGYWSEMVSKHVTTREGSMFYFQTIHKGTKGILSKHPVRY